MHITAYKNKILNRAVKFYIAKYIISLKGFNLSCSNELGKECRYQVREMYA